MPTIERMSKACQRCHRRKIKCDRAVPTCSHCSKMGYDCEYSARKSKRAEIQEIETKLKDLEQSNEELKRLLHQERQKNNQPPQGEHATSGNKPSLDNLASVASSLSLAAAGDTRYVGSSSGVLLAQIVSTTVASATNRRSLTTENSPHLSGMLGPTCSTTNGLSIFQQNLNLDETIDPDTIPVGRSTALTLVSIYFQHTHIAYPFLCETEFMQIFDKIYEEDGFYSKNVYWAFVFDMVLAISSATLRRNQYSNSATRHPYHLNALAKLSSVLCLDGYKSLMAILLLSVYSLMHDSSIGVWQLVGITTRLCTELGLHRDNFGAVSPGDPGFFSIEMRRRCFWSVFALDRIVSVTTGRPLALHDNDIDVPLPSTHLDSCIYGQQGCDGNCPSYTCFIQLLKLRDLTGKISRVFYSKKVAAPGSLHVRLKDHFKSQLDLWLNDIPRLGLNNDHHGGQPSSCFLYSSWYMLLYYNAKQLLHRPSLVFMDLGEDDLLQVLECSRGSLKVYADLCKTRRLNYSCLALHSVFISGISYLYCVAKLMHSPGSLSKLPSDLQLVEESRTCSNVLNSMIERWSSNQELQGLFDKLSSQVISEYMEQRVAAEVNMRLQETETSLDKLQPPSTSFNQVFRELEDIFAENAYLNSSNSNSVPFFNGLEESNDMQQFLWMGEDIFSHVE